MANATNFTVQYNNASSIQEFFTSPTTPVNEYGNLNLSQWTDTLSSLEFDPTKTNFSVIGDTVADLFRPDTFSYPLICGFPISGSYGFLIRLSYYLLLIFALILRKHVYLSTAALGTAMAYGATTCVHAFALLVYVFCYLNLYAAIIDFCFLVDIGTRCQTLMITMTIRGISLRVTMETSISWQCCQSWRLVV